MFDHLSIRDAALFALATCGYLANLAIFPPSAMAGES